MNANLYALIEAHFPREREVPCILIPGGTVVNYGDLAQESARIANALMRAGCRPGDRVAVQADKHWQVLALYLACLRAGLVYLPLNTGYQKDELRSSSAMRSRASSSAARKRSAWWPRIAGDATVLTIDAHGGELGDRARSEPAAFVTVHFRAPTISRPSCTRRGRPAARRERSLTHRNLASNALALVEAWGFTRGDVVLHALPIYHVHGLFVAVHCALLSGARMLWLPKFDAKEVVELAAARDRDDGRADVLRAAACASRHSRATPAATSGCSSPARRRCCRKHSRRFASAPDRRSSSATA